MSGWRGAREAAKQYGGGGSGTYVKVEDGERVLVLFGGTPHVNLQHWDESEGRSVPCTGGECCDKHGPARASFLSYCHDDKTNLRIWELSQTLFDMISEELEEEGFDRWVQVKRKGKGKKTRWTVSAKDRATAKQIAALNRDVDESDVLQGTPLSNAPNATPLDDDDVPF